MSEQNKTKYLDKILEQKKRKNAKTENYIDGLSNDVVIEELKKKGIPSYGTNYERKERLRVKVFGLPPNVDTGIPGYPQGVVEGANGGGRGGTPVGARGVPPPGVVKKSDVVMRVEEMERKRVDRRQKMEEVKREKYQREAHNEALGKNVDVEFDMMVERVKPKLKLPLKHLSPYLLKINVCVRKRPIFIKETNKGEIDIATVRNPTVFVHECKFRVDGITKFIDNHEFNFDNGFHEEESSHDLYQYSIRPNLNILFEKGVLTVFAYGQTGSGKTYTMKGVHDYAIDEIFELASKYYCADSFYFNVSFFEIYGGRLYDLFNDHQLLNLLEDKYGKIQVQGLKWNSCSENSELKALIDYGHSIRTTRCTTSNDTSSRSHAICQILIKDARSGHTRGKLLLVDLAGSERAQDCQSNNRQRRMEGAEINKSLLTLKECIRALDRAKQEKTHIPFRASKLTMVLRDSFEGSRDKIRLVMVACISPGSSSTDHTINTLRYAAQLKEKANFSYEHALSEQEKLGMPGPESAPSIPLSNKLRAMEPLEFKGQRPEALGGRGGNVNPGGYNIKGGAIPPHLMPQGGVAQPVPPVAPVPAKAPTPPEPEPMPPKQPPPRKPPAGGPAHGVKPPPKMYNPIPVSKKEKEALAKADRANLKQIPVRDVAIESSGSSEEDYEKMDVDLVNSQKKIKERAVEDWQYLKQTMHANKDQMPDANFLNFQEKADALLDEEEELIMTHMKYMKDDAQLLTDEGKLITNLRGQVDYDIESYVDEMEKIARRKIEIYSNLRDKIKLFKSHLQEEEELHAQVTGAFFF